MAGVQVANAQPIQVTNKFNKYATKKTLAEGLLDVGLLMSNVSQLKALVSLGPDGQEYYWPNIVLISLSFLLQVVVGVIFLLLGNMEVATPKEKKHVHTLNDVTVGIIVFITIINVFIAGFGMKLSE